MYNLLVGFSAGTALGDRMFEHTDKALEDFVQPSGAVDVNRLITLPTLLMPELDDNRFEPVARIGRLTSLRPSGSNYRFTLTPSPGFPAFSLDQIRSLMNELMLSDWEMRRTHWAIKDVDLYGVLLEAEYARRQRSQVFAFPVERPVEPDLVAVMMPFDSAFDAVYDTITATVERLGLRCHRADDIWENHQIMDDVIDLIWRSQLVVSDLTSKNANVFYETGIAHSIGRNVIQLARSMDDVPFDLRAIRTLQYIHNDQGLNALGAQLADRMATLIGTDASGV